MRKNLLKLQYSRGKKVFDQEINQMKDRTMRGSAKLTCLPDLSPVLFTLIYAEGKKMTYWLIEKPDVIFNYVIPQSTLWTSKLTATG